MSKNLKHLYKGSFKDRVRHFEDGGYASYSLGSTTLPSDLMPVTSDASAQISNLNNPAANLDADSYSSLSNVPEEMATDGIDTSADPKSSGSSSSTSALGKALSALGLGGGNNSNSAIVGALVGLLGAAGKYNQVKTASTLPTMPTLPGGANTSSAGYGPAGGYGFQNYNTSLPGSSGTAASTSGLGYAPVTQAPAKPISSYYTYGQGPQQQFFQQVNTTPGATLTPVTAGMKRGGRVTTPQRYDQGGFALAPTSVNPASTPQPAMQPQVQRPATPAQPSPVAPPVRPTPPVNPVGTAATNMGAGIGGALNASAPKGMQQRPQAPMSTMGQRMAAARGVGFASGGAARNPDGSGYQLPPMQMPQSGLMPSQMPQTLSSVRQQVQRKPAMAGGGALSNMPSGPGVSRHIKGAGDGTSDSIPARLANGEYVIDAQAVSMLGNGDNGAGAKKLDEFRKNLRQHKGGALSKGKMAPDAKPIHQYMGSK